MGIDGKVRFLWPGLGLTSQMRTADDGGAIAAAQSHCGGDTSTVGDSRGCGTHAQMHGGLSVCTTHTLCTCKK